MPSAPSSPGLDISKLSPLHPPTKQYSVPPAMLLPEAALKSPETSNADICLSPTGRAAADVLDMIRSSAEKHRPEHERDRLIDDDDEGGKSQKRIRSSRCGTCTSCLQPDCGSCINCMDKPKFGGPGIKKQACSRRKCMYPNRSSGVIPSSGVNHSPLLAPTAPL